jgi:hypothetical protein
MTLGEDKNEKRSVENKILNKVRAKNVRLKSKRRREQNEQNTLRSKQGVMAEKE